MRLPLLPALLALGALAPASRAQCELQKLLPGTPVPFSKMGISVGLSGPYAIAGAPFDGDGAGSAGAAHLYELTSGGWVHVDKHVAADAAELDRSGWAVALAGEVALVGTRYDEDAGYGTGSVYVLERQPDGSWPQVQKLVASDFGGNDFFGNDVAVSELGILAVGAPLESSQGGASGAVYLFEEVGGVWTETQKIVPPDVGGGDRFGYSLALSGERLVVGARTDDELVDDGGSAYVYERVGGTWVQRQKLLPPDPELEANFGVQVDVDGDRLVVGAPRNGATAGEAGTAYVYALEAGAWELEEQLLASDGATQDFFGDAVAIDGEFVAAGSFGADGAGNNSGRVYLFELQGSDWVEVEAFEQGDPAAGDGFGNSLALDGGRLLAGARSDDDYGPDTGAAYVFSAGTGLLLTGRQDEVSLQTGGVQELLLATCPPRPGAFHFLLGTTSGTEPGIDVAGLHLPLNPDFYFFLSAQSPNLYPLLDSTGILDAEGRGTALFGLGTGESPSLAGTVIHHAFGLIDAQGQLVLETSAPVPVVLVP